MTTFEYIMIFILCWWLALFLVLPIGGKAAENPAQSEYHGAPARARIKAKLVWATGLAFPLSAMVLWGMSSGVFDL